MSVLSFFKEASVFDRRKYTNPYSSNLDKFFNGLATSEQIFLLKELTRNPELKEFIEISTNSDGDITGISVIPGRKEEYQQKKAELKIM
ncbi:MAG: hypothetical protein JSR97_02835 [Verrucomicrobia bacterium]|nr:hypothetical protein [Verrucomicrobiota bacterium]